MWVWFMCAGIANIIIKYGPIIKKKKKKKATRPTLFENSMLLQYNNFFFFGLPNSRTPVAYLNFNAIFEFLGQFATRCIYHLSKRC